MEQNYRGSNPSLNTFYSALQPLLLLSPFSIAFCPALDHINQAWNAEEAYLTVKEELDIREIEANIRNLDSMANFFNGLPTLWILFGIGGILFGIGYTIK